MKSNGTWMRVALMIVVASAAFSCSNEFTRSASPVELIVTNTQKFSQIDLAGNGSSGNTNCDEDLGSIAVEARLKSLGSTVDQRFNDVRITRYRVSYVRTDGGTQVPAPFVRSIDMLVAAGGASANLSKFLILTGDAVTQAPFAALLPRNGGRDPETGRRVVRLDVIVELFGQTLAGTNVSGFTRFPIDFCFSCGGCA